MTLRGADVEIASTANVGKAIAGSTTISNVISTGLSSPRGTAFDSAGNLFVGNLGGSITKVTFTSPGVVNQVVTNFATVGSLPDGLAFDSAGNMYSANGDGTVSKITFSSPGVLGTVNNSFITGLNAGIALAFDNNGNLFIANRGNGKISKATFSSPGVLGTVTDFVDLTSLGVTVPSSIAVDSSNNLYVASNSKIVKVTSAGSASVIVSSGIASDFTIAYFQGMLLAATSSSTLSQYSTSGSLLNASYATSLNTTWQTAPDTQGNLWVVNNGANSVSKVVPSPTLTQLSVRSSVSSLPMSIGGTNTSGDRHQPDRRRVGPHFHVAERHDHLRRQQPDGQHHLHHRHSGHDCRRGHRRRAVHHRRRSDHSRRRREHGTALTATAARISLTAGTGGITALAANNTTAEIATTGAR